MSWILLSNVNPNTPPLFPHSWVLRTWKGGAQPTLPHKPFWAAAALSSSVPQDPVQKSPAHVLLSNQGPQKNSYVPVLQTTAQATALAFGRIFLDCNFFPQPRCLSDSFSLNLPWQSLGFSSYTFIIVYRAHNFQGSSWHWLQGTQQANRAEVGCYLCSWKHAALCLWVECSLPHPQNASTHIHLIYSRSCLRRGTINF